MKKIVAISLALVMVFSLIGCQSEQNKIYEEVATSSSTDQNTSETSGEESLSQEEKIIKNQMSGISIEEFPPYTPKPDDKLSGELIVKMYAWRGGPPAVYFLAQEFMELHPNVKIDFDYDITAQENFAIGVEEGKIRKANYYARLRTELLSGEGNYLLYGSGEELNQYQLSNNGTLLDMLEYFENDPEIDENDYFMDALNAFLVNGKMTSIPISFAFNATFLNRKIMEELGVDLTDRFAVTTSELLDWYEMALESNPDLQFLFSAPGKDKLFQYERVDYIDLDTKRVTFNSPEFTRFLERTNNVINDDPDIMEKAVGKTYGAIANENLFYHETGEEPYSIPYFDGNLAYDMAVNGRVSFATIEAVDMYPLVNFQQPLEYMAGPFAFTSTEGKLGLTSKEDFSVPSSCKNPELAFEFIKYCISNREELTFARYNHNNWSYTHEIALNKNTFSKMAVDAPETIKRVGVAGYAKFEPVDGDALKKTVEQALAQKTVNDKLYGVDAEEIFDEFYVQGIIGAEECAKKIQDRAEIWLGE